MLSGKSGEYVFHVCKGKIPVCALVLGLHIDI